jgi:protein SCO1
MRIGIVIVGAVLAFGAAGCTGEARARGEGGYRGVELGRPIPRPGFTLQTTDGRPFDFGHETKGRVTLLFFGYTSCPDICPVHMANIAAIRRRLPYDQQRRLQVVFVTTDPERDTPRHLAGWLAQFDPEFIGLVGDRETVNGIEASIGLPPSMTGPADPAGRYEVGHASQVIAFSPNDSAYVLYPFGTRQSDWEHDLPRLLDEKWRPPRGGNAEVPPAEQHGH